MHLFYIARIEIQLKRAGFLLLFLLLGYAGAAQTGSIYGKVTDKTDNSELPGVSVVVKGSAKGTIADFNGNYELTGLSPGQYDIEFSFIGYEKVLVTAVRIKAGERKQLNVQLGQSSLTIEQDVVVIGKRPLVDVEQGKTQSVIGAEKIEAAPVRQLQQVLNTQAGVQFSPTGLHIRGGRTYETGFFIDGVSAKDPLAGTGFGIDLGTNALQELEITTGGGGVEFGGYTSGVVNASTKTGGNKFQFGGLYKRDNFGFNSHWQSVVNQQVMQAHMGGPINILPEVLKKRLRFFTTVSMQLSDTYLPNPANQLRSSILPDSTFWSPYQDNRWSGMLKLNYDFDPRRRLSFSYMKNINVNQDLNMLRITGNDVPYNPGYQYAFSLQPDNAATFTHDANMMNLNWQHTPSSRFSYNVILSRFFVHLRGDANGRPWRPDVVNTEFDPRSIVTFPATYFNPNEEVVFVMPAPGLFNNNGITTLWHDHVVEEKTIRAIGKIYSRDTKNRLTFGHELKLQDLRWIDVKKPWIGAPIELPGGGFSQSFRLGEISDIWRVQPAQGAFFISDQIKYLGLIAEVGGRLEYWFPGAFVDNAVADERSPIRQEFRQEYMDETYGLFGRRFKMRFLPRISASFPIKENQVMYFNYGHNTILPHPSFVYTGLNPLYTDRSTLSFVGNPALDPEVDVSYELGLRSQITSDDALSLAAFWKDKYDFITSETIEIPDITGREVSRTIRINSDYARIRGIEATYIKRIKEWFRGQASVAYQVATGQSASSSETLRDILNTGNRDDTREFPLPWDRPWDIKLNALFTVDNDSGLFNVRWLNRMKFYIEGNYRSGRRYTPYVLTGTEPFSGRPIYEQVTDQDKRFSGTGQPWVNVDFNFIKWWKMGPRFDLAFTFEITNVLNSENAEIINPVTGRAYEFGDPVPTEWRDPVYVDPRDPRSGNIPPDNPARFLAPRLFMLGLKVDFK